MHHLIPVNCSEMFPFSVYKRIIIVYSYSVIQLFTTPPNIGYLDWRIEVVAAKDFAFLVYVYPVLVST